MACTRRVARGNSGSRPLEAGVTSGTTGGPLDVAGSLGTAATSFARHRGLRRVRVSGERRAPDEGGPGDESTTASGASRGAAGKVARVSATTLSGAATGAGHAAPETARTARVVCGRVARGGRVGRTTTTGAVRGAATAAPLRGLGRRGGAGRGPPTGGSPVRTPRGRQKTPGAPSGAVRRATRPIPGRVSVVVPLVGVCRRVGTRGTRGSRTTERAP